MGRRYFGTDGIRGEVGVAPITPDFVLRLGYAAGKVLAHANVRGTSGRPTVLIGKDTRVSGYMLEAALEAGFSAAGVDVMLAGPMPTPGVAYLTRALRLAAGVVISASHNPYHDNGIKFFSADGNKLPDETEEEIEAWLDKPLACEASDGLGKARRLDDANGRYIEFCKSTFPAAFDLRGLKLVIDCAHGAAYQIAPHVFHELGADVVPIGVKPNGFNINDKVGATAPEALIAAVKEQGGDLGIALDGDADRLLVVDGDGRLYNGDELLYVLVKDRLETSGKVHGAVGTLMTNLAVEVALQKLSVPFVRAAVGDRYVLEQLRERGWLLGAEGSGHILSLDRHSTGDGIVSALLVLAAMKRSGKTLAQMLEGVALFPQTLINVRMKAGANWKDDTTIQTAIGAAERELGESGRVLIRASGTEPVLRVMVEARDAADAQRHAEAIAGAVRLATA
ncbi:phosphoglucosamine mutase [Burkholderia plantarii]|uniref:Phosphoglucosamine mutase n=1 Tax=Burkholderia plantarii TaxID=41899 RepID=A0A0B6RUC2_BURPL|nr:phosphoglucosamine mutase [Burkholderia plantarii]AJK45759.1 phosphoglucosamine mutase GlmM [Burkholderia plantarii]